MKTMIDLFYPIGSIYMSVVNMSPSNLFGGEWEQLKDKFLLGAGDSYTAGSTGGASTVTLTESQMPSHTHTQNAHSHSFDTGGATTKLIRVGDVDWGYTGARAMSYTSGNYYYPYSTKNTGGIAEATGTASTTATNQNKGGGQAHNNMPPYLTVYMWKRVG